MKSASPAAWIVHKFGGTSVYDAAAFRKVADIIDRNQAARQAVVLSAAKGVTDVLLSLVEMAGRQDPSVAAHLQALRERHRAIADDLLDAAASERWLARFDADRADLEGVLHSTSLLRSAAQNVRDLVAGYGELWSSTLMVAFLEARRGGASGVRWLDARQCVVVEWGPLGPGVQWDVARARLNESGAADFNGTLIIPGFVARDLRGVQTTLGRNGSDFSASIFGSLLDASEIHIWTDVDGVLSADPRRVPNARVIDQLSYNEAMAFSRLGAWSAEREWNGGCTVLRPARTRSAPPPPGRSP
jgi:aspartokinase/homoserine dehydrogenase 1